MWNDCKKELRNSFQNFGSSSSVNFGSSSSQRDVSRNNVFSLRENSVAYTGLFRTLLSSTLSPKRQAFENIKKNMMATDAKWSSIFTRESLQFSCF